jgi:hypothetical protein
MQLEGDGWMPMPQDWMQQLTPAVIAYNMKRKGPSPYWYDGPDVYKWFNAPFCPRIATYLGPKLKTIHEKVKGNSVVLAKRYKILLASQLTPCELNTIGSPCTSI